MSDEKELTIHSYSEALKRTIVDPFPRIEPTVIKALEASEKKQKRTPEETFGDSVTYLSSAIIGTSTTSSASTKFSASWHSLSSYIIHPSSMSNLPNMPWSSLGEPLAFPLDSSDTPQVAWSTPHPKTDLVQMIPLSELETISKATIKPSLGFDNLMNQLYERDIEIKSLKKILEKHEDIFLKHLVKIRRFFLIVFILTIIVCYISFSN